MEIILLESINKLGKAGEIISVKDGFAKNFLLPNKKAIVANKKNKSDLQSKMSQIEENSKNKTNDAVKLKNLIDGKHMKLEMEANDDDNLYGAITQKSIAEHINQLLKVNLSPDKIIFIPIKTLGNHEINVRLYEDIGASITLEIIKKS